MVYIEQALLKDVSTLSRLFDAYRVFYRQPSDLDTCINFLNERLANNECIIYIAKNSKKEIIGFTQLYPIFSSTRLKRAWLLNDLFVMETARGKGISKLLIDRAKQLCTDSGAHGIMLETEKSNTIGNQLYPSVGFQLCNDSTNYYEWNPS